jgi:hypothetical protein
MPVLTLVSASNPRLCFVLHTKDIEYVCCIAGSRNTQCEVRTKSGQTILTSTMFDTIVEAMGWYHLLAPPLGQASPPKRRKR